MTIRFSVIIPVYNGERFLGRALESVFSQTYAPHEIIVVDDGSTDSTPAVLKDFFPRLTVLRTQNRGVSSARNMGMIAARGTHLAFLDSDDIWFRKKLEITARLIDRFPASGVFCSNYIMRYPASGNRLGRHFSCPRYHRELASGRLVFNRPIAEPLGFLARRNFVGSPSACVVSRRTARRAGYFDSRLRFAEDYDYWLRCAANAPFVLIPQTLVYKRTHRQNATRDSLGVLQKKQEVLASALRRSRPAEDVRRQFTLSLAVNCYDIASVLLEQGQRMKAARTCVRGLTYSASPQSLYSLAQRLMARATGLCSFFRAEEGAG